MVKTVVIFGVDNSSSVHGDNNKKRIRQGLDHFQESGKRFVSSFHCNGNNNFWFVNAVKTYQFKVNDSKLKPCPFCSGNVSKKVSF